MKINFVTKADDRLASYRMRVKFPKENLQEEITISTGTSAEADVNCYSKHFDKPNVILGLSTGSDLGYKSLFDICDDHFDRVDGPYYKKACELATVITCNTDRMQERIYNVTGRLAKIIGDPVTFPKLKPRVFKGEPPRILWFGHSTNVTSLSKWLPYMNQEITVVTDKPVQHPKIKFIKWAPGVVEELISEFDIVFIPDNGAPWNHTKSANRALDAVTAGCLVLAENEDIYGGIPGVEIVKNPTDFMKAISQWKDRPEYTEDYILAGQEFVRLKNSDEVIKEQWKAVFKLLEETKLDDKI